MDHVDQRNHLSVSFHRTLDFCVSVFRSGNGLQTTGTLLWCSVCPSTTSRRAVGLFDEGLSTHEPSQRCRQLKEPLLGRVRGNQGRTDVRFAAPATQVAARSGRRGTFDGLVGKHLGAGGAPVVQLQLHVLPLSEHTGV